MIPTVIVLRSEVERLVIVTFKYGQGRLYKDRLIHVMSIAIHVTKIMGKILSNRNTCIILLFYRLHGDIVLIVIVNIIGIVTVTFYLSN